VLGFELGGDGGKAPGRMTRGCVGACCAGCGPIMVIVILRGLRCRLLYKECDAVVELWRAVSVVLENDDASFSKTSDQINKGLVGRA